MSTFFVFFFLNASLINPRCIVFILNLKNNSYNKEIPRNKTNQFLGENFSSIIHIDSARTSRSGCILLAVPETLFTLILIYFPGGCLESRILINSLFFSWYINIQNPLCPHIQTMEKIQMRKNLIRSVKCCVKLSSNLNCPSRDPFRQHLFFFKYLHFVS